MLRCVHFHHICNRFLPFQVCTCHLFCPPLTVSSLQVTRRETQLARHRVSSLRGKVITKRSLIRCGSSDLVFVSKECITNKRLSSGENIRDSPQLVPTQRVAKPSLYRGTCCYGRANQEKRSMGNPTLFAFPIDPSHTPACDLLHPIRHDHQVGKAAARRHPTRAPDTSQCAPPKPANPARTPSTQGRK